jgi:hypothetical protein
MRYYYYPLQDRKPKELSREEKRERIRARISTTCMEYGVSVVEVLDVVSDMVMDNISSHEASGELRRVQ